MAGLFDGWLRYDPDGCGTRLGGNQKAAVSFHEEAGWRAAGEVEKWWKEVERGGG